MSGPTVEPTVDIAVCVTPTGEVHFVPKDQTSVNTVQAKWRASMDRSLLAKHKKHNTGGGVMSVRMLSEDWSILQERQRAGA